MELNMLCVYIVWCLLFVLIRHGFRGGSGPQRLLELVFSVSAVFDCGRVLFGNRVAKRDSEGTVHTKHQLKLDPNPKGT